MSQHQRQPTGFQVLIQILVTSFVIMLALTLVACGTTNGTNEGSAPQVPEQSLDATASSTAESSELPQLTETTLPVLTANPTGLPGTQAPTRIVVGTDTQIPTYPPPSPGSKNAFDTRVTL